MVEHALPLTCSLAAGGPGYPTLPFSRFMHMIFHDESQEQPITSFMNNDEL
jgi:hypothetical protein